LQTLLLASAVIKFLWARAANQNHLPVVGAPCVHHRLSPGQSSDKLIVADFSSSGHSESDASGIDLEEGEIKPHLVADLEARRTMSLATRVKIKRGRHLIVAADSDVDDDEEEDMSNISEASMQSHSSGEELMEEVQRERKLLQQRKLSLLRHRKVKKKKVSDSEDEEDEEEEDEEEEMDTSEYSCDGCDHCSSPVAHRTAHCKVKAKGKKPSTKKQDKLLESPKSGDKCPVISPKSKSSETNVPLSSDSQQFNLTGVRS
jgi:hypothetical protein